MIARALPRQRDIQRFGNRVRRRVLWAFLAFGAGAGATWYFREDIFLFLLKPAGGSLSPFEDGLPVFTAPTDMMGATIHLAMKGGAAAALPVVVAGVYTLIRPIVPSEQRRFIALFFPASALCFAGGAAFAYYVMLPTGLKFLLHFGDGIAVPLITITAYMELLTAMIFWLGIVFQLPLAMYLLAKTRIVSYSRMRRLRKFVPVAAFILSAIITPTFDVINQTMLAVPIIVLYEVGLFLAWLARPEKGDYMGIKKIKSAVGRILRW